MDDAPARRGRRRPRLHRPPGGRPQAGRRARQRKDRARLAGEGKEGPGRHCRCAIMRCEPRFSELSFLHVAAWSFEAVGLSALGAAASRTGARCRRSSGSTLTVSWRFGTLQPPTDRASKAASMIKSELVQRIAAQNPHLYQRDVENIVNAILGEVTSAMARGDRVELRGFGAFSVKHRPARTGRNPRTGAHVSVEQKSVPFFKTGKEMRERLNKTGAGLSGFRADSAVHCRAPGMPAVGRRRCVRPARLSRFGRGVTDVPQDRHRRSSSSRWPRSSSPSRWPTGRR